MYSALDSCIKIPELTKYLTKLGIKSCGISDHGNVYGIVDFYLACKEAGIKPIIGCEVYCTEDLPDSENKNRDNHHLVLLCQNNTGLKNLYWLLNQGALHNFYYKPRIYRPLFAGHSEGLIALSACLAGYPNKMCQYDPMSKQTTPVDRERFDSMISWFASTFRNRFYLEIQDHPMDEQAAFNEMIVEYGHKKDIPLVITSDAHFLAKEDLDTHKMLIALQIKKTLEQYNQSTEMHYNATNCVRLPEEMELAANKYGAPEAIDNTNLISEQCHAEIELGKWKTPQFSIADTPDYNEFLAWKAKYVCM
jgi:DNA polymerase-3 subunit alpha